MTVLKNKLNWLTKEVCHGWKTKAISQYFLIPRIMEGHEQGRLDLIRLCDFGKYRGDL